MTVKVTVEWALEPSVVFLKRENKEFLGIRFGLTTLVSPEVLSGEQEQIRKYWLEKSVQKLIKVNHERWLGQTVIPHGSM